MSILLKQRLSNLAYILIGLPPLVYLITFISFLYYTGNGFGKEFTYTPLPEKKQTYLTWLGVIQELENYWIASFILWILMLIVTFIFFKNIKTSPFILITFIVFSASIYIAFFSQFGGHEGWIGNYYDAVSKISSR